MNDPGGPNIIMIPSKRELAGKRQREGVREVGFIYQARGHKPRNAVTF